MDRECQIPFACRTISGKVKSNDDNENYIQKTINAFAMQRFKSKQVSREKSRVRCLLGWWRRAPYYV